MSYWVTPDAYLSPLDETRFGWRTVRASNVTSENVDSVIGLCREQDAELLIARCQATELDAVHALEKLGGLLMDTLVTYTRDLVERPLTRDTGETQIRELRSGEEVDVGAVAADAFRGYRSHYHADRRLDRAACDEIYVDWAIRCCRDRDAADSVLVAELDRVMAGFAALRLNEAGEGVGVLYGVAPRARRKGIYRSLMVRSMEWCVSKGAERMIIPTQITNAIAQKVWAGLGFVFGQAEYTFHVWFGS